MTRIARNLLFVLALFSISPSIAQMVPCSGGFAGVFPCDGYDLLSNLPKSTFSNEDGSDIWGWTDSTTGKEYTLITFEDKTCFVDVSDPVNPIYLGNIPTNAGVNFWRDIKVFNNYAYIVADKVGSHGMQVFDLTRLRNVSNPPQTFTPDNILTDVGSCHNIAINEDTGFAYLVGCNTFSGGPYFLDLSDPANPVSAGGYSTDGYTHDAQIVVYNGPDTEHQGKEIMIASNENEIVILDVSNKSSVVRISRVDYTDVGYTHQGWLSDDHRYFYLGDETDEIDFGYQTRGLVFDFLDLDNPSFISTFTGNTNAIDHNYYTNGNKLYQANYTAGLRILDITNPMNVTEIGYFDTHPESNNTTFFGAWSVYPYFASGNIIISDIDRGLIIIRDSNLLSTTEAPSFDFMMYPNPASNHTMIRAGENMLIQTIEVRDILGKKVTEHTNINEILFQLPVSKFPSGMYVVKINNTTSQKLVVN
ncbi:choice-of-anchor B family protein [Kordia sp.]|uniref:choice-of-anchor B family protein n=1 Tax=Kordia sp. TaxID=1965332 RepID=UPI0025BD612A|nr:choice-of-anchor B family protein [Kordia sp.]MCH2193408.1 choice-of-anchor B family protein [Kordia sp.]